MFGKFAFMTLLQDLYSDQRYPPKRFFKIIGKIVFEHLTIKSKCLEYIETDLKMMPFNINKINCDFRPKPN